MPEKVTIIGAGLAGSEAAWQAAQRGVPVCLYEMRPVKMTPAHKTGYFAELVCSNSLRARAIENAVGLLKEEMRKLGSIIMKCADESAIPAGGALAVDREVFAQKVTQAITFHPLIQVERTEMKDVPGQRPLIIATGPLTSPSLSQSLTKLVGNTYLYFYDAVSPIVYGDSIDFNYAFCASRYGKGGDDYINCPLTEEEYNIFWNELVNAEKSLPHLAEEKNDEIFFEGCMPVEVLAERGKDTLLFGPLKPVGLIDPRTGKQPFAVVQLRHEDQQGTLYNMVGFQTRLKWPEQRRVFRLIPALRRAEFVRYGVVHRNTFINSPLLLKPTLEQKENEGIFWAGQITGVEGYVESAATGLIAGINAARYCKNEPLLIFPLETAHGALCHFLHTSKAELFQPMNVNFGLFPPARKKLRKREKRAYLAKRALEVLDNFIRKI